MPQAAAIFGLACAPWEPSLAGARAALLAAWDMPLLPDTASTMAGRTDALTLALVLFSTFFTVLIAGCILVFAIRYRRSRNPKPSGPHVSYVLEVAWTAIPFLLIMGAFAWGASLYLDMTAPPSDARRIYVVGRQWMWKLQHPEGRREIDTLHVPRGQPVQLVMTSQDVIHSFYIPAFRVKMDVVPGRYTTLWFEPTKPGVYHLFCAEYCGARHARMVGRVVVMEPARYQAWLAGGDAGETLAERGGRLFDQMGCATCHLDARQAPALQGLLGRRVRLADGSTTIADEGYVRESIIEPQAKVVAGFDAVMPTFKGQVSEMDIIALIEFLRGFGEAEGPGGAPVGGEEGGERESSPAPRDAEPGADVPMPEHDPSIPGERAPGWQDDAPLPEHDPPIPDERAPAPEEGEK